MDNRNDLWRHVDASKDRLIALSDRVWGMPEVCYTEARSCAEHVAELKHQGFRVTENLAGIPTAVMGEAGEGGPVIAFLGEYDALPGLSQEAGIAEHREIEAGGHGHGCGHNLLGSAALLAGGGDEELAGRERHRRPRPLLRLPGGRRRRRQGLHGPRRAPSPMPTSPSPGIRPASGRSRRPWRSPIPAPISFSPAAQPMPPPRRISGAARSMRSS